jgi:hypothetical protein
MARVDHSRIWRKVAKGDDGCWLWTGGLSNNGYAYSVWNGRTEYVHRICFILITGEDIDGVRFANDCGNRHCVNPDHWTISRNWEDRFWGMVQKGESPDSCWNWKGNTATNYGYGRFWKNGNHVVAHRLMYEIENGEIPDGFEICHYCDTPSCVNPHHLFIGTHKQNMQDMSDKGRARNRYSIETLGGVS